MTSRPSSPTPGTPHAHEHGHSAHAHFLPHHDAPPHHPPEEDLAYIQHLPPRLRTSVDSELADEYVEAVRVASRPDTCKEDASASPQSAEVGAEDAPPTVPLVRVQSVGPPPDGGLRAWLVVIGSAFSILCVLGLVTGAGQFQQYYLAHQLRDYSTSEVA